MKKTTSQHREPSLRFVRWSRKSFSAFCSVGRCVTIGCLSSGIIDASLRKQPGRVDASGVAGVSRHEGDAADEDAEEEMCGTVPPALIAALAAVQSCDPYAARAQKNQNVNIEDNYNNADAFEGRSAGIGVSGCNGAGRAFFVCLKI